MGIWHLKYFFFFGFLFSPCHSVQQDACDIHISCDSRTQPRGTFPCNPCGTYARKLYGTAIENVILNVNYNNQKYMELILPFHDRQVCTFSHR